MLLDLVGSTCENRGETEHSVCKAQATVTRQYHTVYFQSLMVQRKCWGAVELSYQVQVNRVICRFLWVRYRC